MPEEKVVDDMDEAAIDAETYKAREWDDFKDANPRGWGKLRNVYIKCYPNKSMITVIHFNFV